MRNMIMILLCLLSQMAVAQDNYFTYERDPALIEDTTLSGVITFSEPTCIMECRQVYRLPFKSPQKIFCQFEGKRAKISFRVILDFSKAHRVDTLLPNVKYVEAKDYQRCLKIEHDGKLYTFETSGEDYPLSLKDFMYHLRNKEAMHVTSIEAWHRNNGKSGYLIVEHSEEEQFFLDAKLEPFPYEIENNVKRELSNLNFLEPDCNLLKLLEAILY